MCFSLPAFSGLKEEGILRVPGNAGRVKVENPLLLFLVIEKVQISFIVLTQVFKVYNNCAMFVQLTFNGSIATSFPDLFACYLVDRNKKWSIVRDIIV